MAVTLTTRPSTWSAVKNPVVYKFTSTGHSALDNYRIEVEVFKASDDSSLTGGVKLSFSPNADGVSYADVSTIIKAYLSPDWIEPSVLNEVETDTFLKFYVKHQELYDGSATSVVDDVANPRYAVFGGLQIPSANGNNLTNYVPGDSTKQFLTIFERPKIWRGYPATLSFIFPDALALYALRTQSDASGADLGGDIETLDVVNDDSVNRLDLLSGLVLDADAAALAVQLGIAGSEVLTNPEMTGAITPWFSAGGGDVPWSDSADFAAVNFTSAGQVSDPLRQDITEQPAGYYILLINVIVNTGDQATFRIAVYNNGLLVQELIEITYDAGVTEVSYPLYITGAFDRIEATATLVIAGGSPVFAADTISLKSPGDYTEELTFDVQDPCDNPIMLFWKNSVGGDAWWLFEYGQEMGYSYSRDKKAKRMTLFAEHLTENQWEALNELNTIGEIYQQNIQEFTSSVNKTSARDGAQVYMVDEDGNKTGVIVIPSNSVINTKDELHSIQIEIELPARYE